MKKLKTWFFVIGIFVCLIVFAFGRKVYGNMTMQGDESAEEKMELGEKKMNETDEEKVEYVDEKMNEALASDKYREMSLTERREFADDLLSQFEQEGYITGLQYNEDGLMYSFEYADGTLGGWRIEDFSSKEGVLPMN